MKMQIKSLKFWGRFLLEYLGLTVGSAVVLMLLNCGGFWRKGETAALFELFPYYLMLVGVLLTGVISISFFQVYFPALLSMNVTRKSIVRGLLLMLVGNAACQMILSALVWYVGDGDISRSGRILLPWIAGMFLVLTALFLMLGAVLIRWGKVGVIITGIVYMALGACVGILVAVSSKDLFGARWKLFVNYFGDKLASSEVFYHLFPIALGLLIYAGAGFFVRVVTKKTQVRG